MKKILKYIGLLIVPFSLMVSCSDDTDYPDTTANETVIYGIKIVNGGLDGTETIVGTVDENKKEISFPEVNMESDLSHVQFEVEASDGAVLDSADYNFVVPEGATQRQRIITLLNGTRYREYYVTIRLDVPVWGADFTKYTAYDFSGATHIYPDLAAANTRAADMDKDYVLMVSRQGGIRPHLLRISDLKEGNSSNPIMLSTTNVTGGTFPISAGRLSHGHVYICNLATPPAGAGARKSARTAFAGFFQTQSRWCPPARRLRPALGARRRGCCRYGRGSSHRPARSRNRRAGPSRAVPACGGRHGLRLWP